MKITEIIKIICPNCNGKGRLPKIYGNYTVLEECMMCFGTGKTEYAKIEKPHIGTDWDIEDNEFGEDR